MARNLFESPTLKKVGTIRKKLREAEDIAESLANGARTTEWRTAMSNLAEHIARLRMRLDKATR